MNCLGYYPLNLHKKSNCTFFLLPKDVSILFVYTDNIHQLYNWHKKPSQHKHYPLEGIGKIHHFLAQKRWV